MVGEVTARIAADCGIIDRLKAFAIYFVIISPQKKKWLI
jgi:hypothetical protein